jgi:hypothetical protein
MSFLKKQVANPTPAGAKTMTTKKKKKKSGVKKSSAKKSSAGKKKKKSNPSSKKTHHSKAKSVTLTHAQLQTLVHGKKTKKKTGKKKRHNPSGAGELLDVGLALGAGVLAGTVVTLASVVAAPTSQPIAYALAGLGVAGGIGVALTMDPVIGASIAVGSAAPLGVNKLATAAYNLIAKPAAQPAAAAAPATAPAAAPAAAPTTTKGMGENPYGMGNPHGNPFGMGAVTVSTTREGAARNTGMNGVTVSSTRAGAAKQMGMGAAGNPFGMGAAGNPFGMGMIGEIVLHYSPGTAVKH